jgi:hypothetical protein
MKLISWRDVVATVAFLLVVGIWMAFRFWDPQGDVRAEIWVDGERVLADWVDLPIRSGVYQPVPGVSIVFGQDNTAWFHASDCPDQVCVRTGKLRHAGQAAVCLPNRVVLRLVGAAPDGLDAITG